MKKILPGLLFLNYLLFSFCVSASAQTQSSPYTVAQLLEQREALAASGVLTYGSNVKEVTTQVSEAAVDCGVIYATDAFSAGLTVVDTATAEMCGQVIYPAAVLNISQHQAEAQALLDYLRSPAAAAVFEAVGFTSLG